MNYAFDPELAPAVPEFAAPDLSEPPPAAEPLAAPALAPARSLSIRDLRIPGPTDAPEVLVRIYQPAEIDPPLPALLYLHAGGFVAGDLNMVHDDAAQLSEQLRAVVVAVNYRLAPADPFPAALLDCYAALEWVEAESRALGVDPGRIGLYGESAGGGLAAGLSLLTRDRGGPHVRIQALAFPALDHRRITTSMRTFTDTPMWTTSTAAQSWTHYLANGTSLEGRDAIAYASPAAAPDLAGLAPAFVSACEFDPLRDEALAYAQRLLDSGVSCEVHQYRGTFHASTLITDAHVTRRMREDRRTALHAALTAA